MTLENLIGKGLQREPASQVEIARFCVKIDTKLTDAQNMTLSLDTRFDVAYEALLQIGFAALRANGYRPDSRGGHHVLALQTLATSIGYPQERIRLLDEYRRQRGLGLYDGSFEPSAVEVAALIEEATNLMKHFQQWLAATHPELI